jgi:carbamate kinase
MIKLLNILEEQNRFKTTKIDKDPQTGTITWKVEYTPLLSLNKNLDKVYSDFQKAAEKNLNDTKLQEYLEAFALLKKGLRSHITRTYGKNK